MQFQLPLLRPKSGAWSVVLRLLALAALTCAAINAIYQYGYERFGLSGDEYYFYYAAAGKFVGVPSDPVWSMQAELRNARAALDAAARNDAPCRQATEAARGDLQELAQLLRTETSAQGYGPSSRLQGVALAVWNAFSPPAPGSDPGYALSLGARIAAGVGLPMAFVFALCFVGAGVRRSVTVLCLLGAYVLLHALVAPTANYWGGGEDNLQDLGWIMKNLVAVPFANPWYPDSLFAIQPRAYLLLPFLLALACRWVGALRWSYALLGILPFFHAPIGTITLLMMAAVDVLARPQVFRDRGVAVLALVGVVAAAAGHAGLVFRDLVGGPWVAVAGLAGLAAAAAYVSWMPRRPGFARRSAWWSERVVLLDVLVFGPGFFLGWIVLGLVHVHFGLITDYGLVQLGVKTSTLAHHVFFFGLVALAFAAITVPAARRIGEARTATLLMATAVVLSAVVTAVLAQLPRSTSDSILERFAKSARHYEAEIAARPLRLGAFETHLLWHRIIRQRETGGDWVRRAIDLEPFRAVCRLPG